MVLHNVCPQRYTTIGIIGNLANVLGAKQLGDVVRDLVNHTDGLVALEVVALVDGGSHKRVNVIEHHNVTVGHVEHELTRFNAVFKLALGLFTDNFPLAVVLGILDARVDLAASLCASDPSHERILGGPCVTNRVNNVDNALVIGVVLIVHDAHALLTDGVAPQFDLRTEVAYIVVLVGVARDAVEVVGFKSLELLTHGGSRNGRGAIGDSEPGVLKGSLIPGNQSASVNRSKHDVGPGGNRGGNSPLSRCVIEAQGEQSLKGVRPNIDVAQCAHRGSTTSDVHGATGGSSPIQSDFGHGLSALAAVVVVNECAGRLAEQLVERVNGGLGQALPEDFLSVLQILKSRDLNDLTCGGRSQGQHDGCNATVGNSCGCPCGANNVNVRAGQDFVLGNKSTAAISHSISSFRSCSLEKFFHGVVRPNVFVEREAVCHIELKDAARRVPRHIVAPNEAVPAVKLHILKGLMKCLGDEKLGRFKIRVGIITKIIDYNRQIFVIFHKTSSNEARGLRAYDEIRPGRVLFRPLFVVGVIRPKFIVERNRQAVQQHISVVVCH